MIKFEKFTLDNGLRVIVHEDKSTPIVAVNLVYDVGARDESPNKTGFAHLFEHLMFGGSKNIENFDEPLQNAGGQNNAFTSNDITNYYCTLPVQNIETALWLESDRLDGLAFTPKSLEVQRNVVIEEFKQRYLNQPYGDVWLLLRPLAYQEHPYQWATIGKEIRHIEEATMEDVQSFFYKHYGPQNVVLSIAGDISAPKAKTLVEKWFGTIDTRTRYHRNLPKEPVQKELRTLTVERDVPSDAIYLAFKMGNRKEQSYYTADVISDILSRGESSRLYKKLIKESPSFTDINAYITGSLDEGLFIISGKPIKGISLEEAYQLITAELALLQQEKCNKEELTMVKNKIESTTIFSEMSVLNKAMGLGFYELLGDANMINFEEEKYHQVTADAILEEAKTLFLETNCSVLFYKSKNN
ncbi:MAG: insulinase family protein [Flavobacteriales bacterium]|jgi:predicted Zn-dependent peptidase|nr:insulinase family protein [Flavobacteriales bacterium]